MSWHFLARPPNDPSAVGLLSLRLETTWFSTLEDAGDGNAGQPGAGDTGAESPTSQGAVSAAGSLEDWDQASGGRRGPLQWDEERAVMFIQVCCVCSEVVVSSRLLPSRFPQLCRRVSQEEVFSGSSPCRWPCRHDKRDVLPN